MQADPQGDLSTELERELGKLVKEKYKTDFYMLYNYPLAVCAMPPLSFSLLKCFQNVVDCRLGLKLVHFTAPLLVYVTCCLGAGCIVNPTVGCLIPTMKLLNMLKCELQNHPNHTLISNSDESHHACLVMPDVASACSAQPSWRCSCHCCGYRCDPSTQCRQHTTVSIATPLMSSYEEKRSFLELSVSTTLRFSQVT